MSTHVVPNASGRQGEARSGARRPFVLLAWRTIVIVVLCLASAEATARLEDLLFDGVPLTANPTPDSQLVFTGPDGITRGRPGGRYGSGT